MYKKTMVGCVLIITVSGCTRNANLQNENRVNLNFVHPTENELAHANYGNSINVEEFENAVRSKLKDPYSAKI